jgi:formamidopyrimidine-DNA glycosylase
MIDKNIPIKSALLDQTAIAGIGNIYSDEILWQTSIHPLSSAGQIPKAKFAEIFKAMQTILKFSIKVGGDSKSDYRNAFGGKGGFQNFHQVYGKKGLQCPKNRCSGIIERTVIKGRSSHFCPKHQIKY